MTEREAHPVDLLAELALGVLRESEAAPIRGHLAECESCREEYEEMERVARLLPFAVEDVEPSPTVKDGLMQRIASEPRPLVRPVKAIPRWRWAGAIAASAAALVVAGGVLGAVLFGPDNGSLETENARQGTLVQAFAQGTAAMTSAEQSGSKTTLLRAPGAHEAFIWVSHLPQLPEGKAYQAWFIRDGKAEPSTVFETGEGGVWIEASDAVERFAVMGLTIEDKDGAQTPSQAPFIAVDLNGSVMR